MGLHQEDKKIRTLKLRYGEYYDLKITDANKNIINQVEITPTCITTEFLLLSGESNKEQLNNTFAERDREGDIL